MQGVHWESFSHCTSMLLQEIWCRVPTDPLLWWRQKTEQWWLWEVWSINCSSINIPLSCSQKHAIIVGVYLFGPVNWWWKCRRYSRFWYSNQITKLSSCADEDTFQNVLNEFPERYTMGVTTPFLHLSTDKDNVIKNIIHHCCISSCLEEIRSVQKGMSTLGVSIVLFFWVS